MSNADFEQKKRSVVNTLNSVLRTGALKERDLGQQGLVILVTQLLEQAGPEGPLPLAPLYDYLKERGFEDDDIMETLLALKEREQSLNLSLMLPPAMEQLPDEKRQQLLLRYQRRQTGPRMKLPAPSRPSNPGLPLPPPAAAGGAWLPTRTKALLGALVVVLLLGGGAFLWLDRGPPPAAPVVLDAPNGLSCKELKGNQGVLFCWMEAAVYEGLGPSERKTRGLATKAAASGLGYTTLQVWTLGDNKLREVH